MEDIEGVESAGHENTETAETTGAEISPSEKAHVSKWLKTIERAEKAHKKPFAKMRKCMDIVAFGSDKEWDDNENYTVPVLSRHINLAVSQLYAKNPKATVKRKRRLMYTVWDGKPETLQLTQAAAETGDPAAAQKMQALIQDIQNADAYNTMADRTAQTLEILWDHILDEQTLVTKTQLKSLVRRTKTTGVGYVKMDFQREYETSPKVDDRMQDSTEQISRLEQLKREDARGDIEEDSSEVAEFNVTQRVLSEQEPLIREGIVFSYPKSTRILVDPARDDLKTLAGARWVAEILNLTPREIEQYYGVQVKGEKAEALKMLDLESDKGGESGALKVFEIQDRSTGTFLTVCEGHDGYLKEPGHPPVYLERFFTVFPLVFNDIEHESELFPPSDVWRSRHMQAEYNRSRQSRREHRVAARPYWVSRLGAMETSEKKKLQNRSPHELIEIAGLQDGQPVDAVLQRGPSANIDPNLYETETINTDILRTVGAQEANLGGLSGATATEASIGESSRSASNADNVDDLDDLLTLLARCGGTVLLAEMSKEMVMDIVGPGAVWPDAPPTRAELAKELMLSIEAGSSGRPNKAADMANMERGLPFIMQMPDISPKPIAKKFGALLDIDFDELYAAGALSMVAQNAIAGSAGKTAGGPIPSAQGGAGGGSQSQEQPQASGSSPGMTQPGEQVVSG